MHGRKRYLAIIGGAVLPLAGVVALGGGAMPPRAPSTPIRRRPSSNGFSPNSLPTRWDSIPPRLRRRSATTGRPNPVDLSVV